MKKMKLPKKMSDLLELALGDMLKVERMKRTYKVNMKVWHRPCLDDAACYVCLAGSVLAMTFKEPPTKNISPRDYTDEIYHVLMAINALRVGNVEDAAYNLGIEPPFGFKFGVVPVADYALDPRAFKNDMRRLIKSLRKMGC